MVRRRGRRRGTRRGGAETSGASSGRRGGDRRSGGNGVEGRGGSDVFSRNPRLAGSRGTEEGTDVAMSGNIGRRSGEGRADGTYRGSTRHPNARRMECSPSDGGTSRQKAVAAEATGFAKRRRLGADGAPRLAAARSKVTQGRRIPRFDKEDGAARANDAKGRRRRRVEFTGVEGQLVRRERRRTPPRGRAAQAEGLDRPE